MSNHRTRTPGLSALRSVSRSVLASAAVLAIAALTGVLIGWVMVAGQKPTHTATAVMVVESDSAALSDQLATQTGPDATTEAAFMSGEIARLNSQPMSKHVEALAESQTVKYTVTEVGTSNLVTVSATDPNPETAKKAVDGLIHTYQTGRRASARSGLQAQLRDLSRRIADLRKSPPSEALNTEIGRLLAQQSSTTYALSRVDQLGAVDTPTYLADSSSLSGKVIMPVLLGVLMAVLAGALLALARGTDRTLRTPGQLGRLGIRVLFPILPLDQAWARGEALHALMSQLPEGRRERIWLVDVDGHSGASDIAAWLRERFSGVVAESIAPGHLEARLPSHEDTRPCLVAVSRLGFSSLSRTREVLDRCADTSLPCVGVLLTVGSDEE